MKTVTCKECNQHKKHYAKGLCAACYHRNWVHNWKQQHPNQLLSYTHTTELRKLIEEMDEIHLPLDIQESYLFGGRTLKQKLEELDNKYALIHQ